MKSDCFFMPILKNLAIFAPKKLKMRFFGLTILLFVFLSSCSESADQNEGKKQNSELIGVWSLQGQAFEKGKELDVSPENAMIKLEISEDGTWRTMYDNNDVSSGVYEVNGDQIIFHRKVAQVKSSYKRLELKFQIHDGVLEIEGDMYFDEQPPGYMHATFVK